MTGYLEGEERGGEERTKGGGLEGRKERRKDQTVSCHGYERTSGYKHTTALTTVNRLSMHIF